MKWLFAIILLFCAWTVKAQSKNTAEALPHAKGYRMVVSNTRIYSGTRHGDTADERQTYILDEEGRTVEVRSNEGTNRLRRTVYRYADGAIVEETVYGAFILNDLASIVSFNGSARYDENAVRSRELTRRLSPTSTRTEYNRRDTNYYWAFKLTEYDSVGRPTHELFTRDPPRNGHSWSNEMMPPLSDTTRTTFFYTDSTIEEKEHQGRYLNSSIFTTLNSFGKPMLVVTERSNTRPESVQCTYDSAGRQTQVKVLNGFHETQDLMFDRIDYEYDAEGKRILERYSIQGKLEGEVRWEYIR